MASDAANGDPDDQLIGNIRPQHNGVHGEGCVFGKLSL
jgi:hypothetical protein